MKLLPKYIEPKEVKDLMEALEDGYNIQRNKTLVWMLYTTGLRVSELVNLNKQDIVKNGEIVSKFTIKGKGNKERPIYLNPKTREYLKKYLGKKKNIPGALFTHSKGERLSRFAILRVIKKAGKKAGLGDKVGAHTLRHSYAVHLMNEGVNMRKIQDFLGHESLNTTMLYTKVGNKDMEDTINNIEF